MAQKEELILELIKAIDNGDLERFREEFFEFHPIDQIEIFLTLDIEQRKTLYSFISPREFAEIFQEMDLKLQKDVILELEDNYLIEMFNEMANDDLADLLEELPPDTIQKIIKDMDIEEAHEVKSLLTYAPETAGALMTTEFLAYKSTDTVASVLEKIREEAPDAETIYYLYIVNELDLLVGVLSIRDLITAPLDKKIEDVMAIRVISVNVDTDQEEVANIIKKYNFLAIPVTDSLGTLLGIITVDDVIDVLEEETTEDFAEISAARGAVDLEISPLVAARKRLPWLIILLFIGMVSATIIGRFEKTLETVAILTIFIPLIAGMGGNTGTQSLAVVVRGLALGEFDKEKVIYLLKREAITGVIMGIVCGVIVSVLAQFITGGNLVLGLIVGISLFLTIITASLSGTIIPFLIHLLKIDPAIASGPFITTINDIIGILIYFSIATKLLKFL